MTSHPAAGPTWLTGRRRWGSEPPHRHHGLSYRRRRRGLLLDRPADRHVREIRPADLRARRARLRTRPRRDLPRLRRPRPGGGPGAALDAGHDAAGARRLSPPDGHGVVRATGHPHRPAAASGGGSRNLTGAVPRGLVTVRVMPEPVLPTTPRVLLARTARVQREGRAPSLVAGVVRDGGLAWSAGRGAAPEPHADVQYRLGSISKTVTAVAGVPVRDEGRPHPHDPPPPDPTRTPLR